jgi:hypothetical protein
MFRNLEKEVNVLHDCLLIACCGTRRDAHCEGGLTDTRCEEGAVLVNRSGEGCDLRGGRGGGSRGGSRRSRRRSRDRRSRGHRSRRSDHREKCRARLLEIRRAIRILQELTALCDDDVTKAGILLHKRDRVEVDEVHEKSGISTLRLSSTCCVHSIEALLHRINDKIIMGGGNGSGRGSSRDEGVRRTGRNARGLTSSISGLCGCMTLAFKKARRTTGSRRGHSG